MPIKVSKALTDNSVRVAAMKVSGIQENDNFRRVSNQSFGVIVEDAEGVQRYCEVRFIARALDKEMTAEEILQSDIAEMNRKIAKAEQTKKDNAEKAAKDKAKREKDKADKENAAK